MGKLVIMWGTSIGYRSWMGKNGNLLRRWNSEKVVCVWVQILGDGALRKPRAGPGMAQLLVFSLDSSLVGRCSSSLIWPLCLLFLLIYNLFLQNQSVNPEMTATGARRSLYKRSAQWSTPQCSPHSGLMQLPRTADSPPLCKLGLCTRTSWAEFPQESESFPKQRAGILQFWLSVFLVSHPRWDHRKESIGGAISVPQDCTSFHSGPHSPVCTLHLVLALQETGSCVSRWQSACRWGWRTLFLIVCLFVST